MTLTVARKLGFYKVNNLTFDQKIQAILEANKTRCDIEWYFNDDIYNKLDWKVEPVLDLLSYYRLRAQQIRDQYDYVIVMASGGADSTNVVYSFLKNGIHIDEIIAAAPLSGLSNYDWNDKDFSPENTISETKFAQMPLLQEIKTNYPNVKITIHDYFEDMLQYKTDEWIFDASSHINLSVAKHKLDKFSHIKNLAESGKKIAKVYGIDKPVICRTKSGDLYSVFIDQIIQVPQYKSVRENYSNLETVLFYYTPDMPDLTLKQSHVLAKWLYLPENRVAKNTMWDLGNEKTMFLEKRMSIHSRLTAKSLYPLLEDRNVFQADKSHSGMAFIPFDNWFVKLHSETKLMDHLRSDSRAFLSKIDSKYFDHSIQVFKRHLKFWNIGHESQFILT